MLRIILISLAGFLLLAPGTSAQQPGMHHGDSMSTMGGRPMTGAMMTSMMDSADAKLDRLVTIMNQSTGGRKVQAMAAVITELVAQRNAMRMHAKQMMGAHAMMGDGAGGGRNTMRNMRRPSPDTAPAPAAPDTTDQHHQP